MVHAAITTRSCRSTTATRRYLVGVRPEQGASAAAAADAAAHDVLVEALPGAAGRDRPAVRDARSPRVPPGRKAAGVRARPAGRREDRRAARQRRLGRGARCRSQPGTNAGDYQLTPPAFDPAACSPTGRTSSRSSCARANQFRPAPPPALDEPEVRGGHRRGQGARLRRGLDAHARPDADRPVLEPADLGGLEPHRADRRARPPRRPVAERAHVRSAQRDLRGLGDRVLRRQVRLPRLASGDRDPRGRRRRQPGHRGRPQLDAALDHGARSVVPRGARHDQRRGRGRAGRRATATTSRSPPTSAGAAGRRALVRRASPRRPRRRA